MRSKSQIPKALGIIFDIELKAAMLALVVMMLVVVADVFMRYAFNAPIRGSYDIVEICLVIFVFFGIPSVIAERQEIVIDLIDGLAPKGLVRLFSAIAAVLAAAVLIFIFWSMLRPATDAYRYGDVRLELNLPVWIIWAIALTGFAGAILAALSAVLGRDETKVEPIRQEGMRPE
jgi:TRAP-type C4-dicarboxylate transport system permease small subunit